MPLLRPKEHTITDMDGKDRTFVLSRLPYTVARKIGATYSISNIPKIGDYKTSDESMLELMSYIGVRVEGRDDPLQLSTRSLVDNHIPDARVGLLLEKAMLGYNFGFFEKGSLSGFLSRQIQEHLPSIIETLTPLLPPSLVQDFVVGLNSKKAST